MSATHNLVVCILSVGLVISGSHFAHSQTYPNKPVRILTSGAGGGSDFTARLVAQGISPALGQPLVVENRGSLPATEATAHAPPDGYTVLVTGATLWVTPLLRKVNYETKDFAPITLISREVDVLSVHPSLPVRSVSELIALAKSKPGQLNLSAGTKGSATHLGAEVFMSMANINAVYVPYDNTPLALTGLITGEIQIGINDVRAAMAHVKSGRLRALAVTSSQPSPLAPGLPTVAAAANLPGFEILEVTGIWAPAKTPPAIVTRLNQEIVRWLRTPDTVERLSNTGSDPVGNTPEQFDQLIQSSTANFIKVIKDARIKLD